MLRASVIFASFVVLLAAGVVLAAEPVDPQFLPKQWQEQAAALVAGMPAARAEAAPAEAIPEEPTPMPASLQSVQVVRPIRAQSVLTPDDLTIVNSRVPGAAETFDQVIGREAKVALYPGRPIFASQLATPALVERNALVKMIYVDGPLRIATDGRVLDRAAAGELVRVMNLTSKQTVTGTVAPDGTITVGQQ